MSDVEENIEIIRRKGQFSSREAVLDEVLRSYLRENPDLRLELAVERFETGSISINRGAELAGLSPSEFRDLIAERGLDRPAGFLSEDERTERLNEL